MYVLFGINLCDKMEAKNMPNETGMKRIVVETPLDLHQKFKIKVCTEGKTIKETILRIMEVYVGDNSQKGKK